MTTSTLVRIESAGVVLQGEYSPGSHPVAAIVVADGIRRARLSHRHRLLTEHLAQASFTTLLADLVTSAEAALDPATAWRRLDVGLLAGRLSGIIDWLRCHTETGMLPTGALATGSGVPPTLLTAARRPSDLRALVCWDGRPNLSASNLAQVTAPTLLIASSSDGAAVELNEHTARYLNGPCKLYLPPDSAQPPTHTPTPTVTRILDWFSEHLRPNGTTPGYPSGRWSR